jgi:outer membrane murein-binding lipoprotein Lpp
MKKQYLLPAALCLGLWLPGCSGNDAKSDQSTATASDSTTAHPDSERLTSRPGPNVQAVMMPDPGIPGYKFPEDSAVINGWVQRGDAASIARHGWGIWTALSSPTGQRVGNDTLRVYETWPTKTEVDAAQQSAPKANARAMLLQRPKPQHRLNRPRQLFRDPDLRRALAKKARLLSAHAMVADSAQDVFESVSYDPVAAGFIVQNKLFWASSLQGLIDKNQGDIPQLPRESIAIKPVYEVVPGAAGSPLYQMKVWTGTTAARIKYGQGRWPSSVYVDVSNRGRGGRPPPPPPTTSAISCTSSSPPPRPKP